jgi:S-adenosylmethionine synthetase
MEQLDNLVVSNLEVEIVERKGKGHPDSLIDGACEAVSRSLSKHYLEKYGRILHHNIDKGLIVGGRSNPFFGGGEVIEPIYLMVAGRAVNLVIGEGKIEQTPIGSLTISSIKNFLKSTMRNLNLEDQIIIDYKIKQGSIDLISVFDKSEKIPLANDTSIGVGYAPLSPTEKLVLETEKYLNSSKLKDEIAETGEDIKIMAFRNKSDIRLTLAIAMISKLIRDKSHYISVIEDIKRRVEDLSSKITSNNVSVRVNKGDDYDKGVFYLTVTGTSAESGDDGNTGRGNRLNGLITPMRQSTMEATCGKNPFNHTGKLFNVLAQRMSNKILEEVNDVKEVYVRILSRIGKPIDEPQIASIALILDKNVALSSVKSEIESIANEQLTKVTELTSLMVNGSIPLF